MPFSLLGQDPHRSPAGAVQAPYAESYLESPLTMRVPSIGSRRSGSLLQAQHCGVDDQATRGPRLYLHDSRAPSGTGHETSLTGREAKLPDALPASSGSARRTYVVHRAEDMDRAIVSAVGRHIAQCGARRQT
jgi:hypothetical protein